MGKIVAISIARHFLVVFNSPKELFLPFKIRHSFQLFVCVRAQVLLYSAV